MYLWAWRASSSHDTPTHPLARACRGSASITAAAPPSGLNNSDQAVKLCSALSLSLSPSTEKDLPALPPGADVRVPCWRRGKGRVCRRRIWAGRATRGFAAAATAAGAPPALTSIGGKSGRIRAGGSGQRGRWGVRTCCCGGGEGGRDFWAAAAGYRCWQAGKGKGGNSAYNSWTGRQNIYTDKDAGEANGAKPTMAFRRRAFFVPSCRAPVRNGSFPCRAGF
jgi:hypothetical protein